MIIFMIGLYSVCANILMVNLLIAMMSSTFAQVSEKSLQIWARRLINALDDFSHRL